MDQQNFLQTLQRIVDENDAVNRLPLEQLLDAIDGVGDLDLPAGTPVLVRCDVDVAIKDGQVVDNTRLESIAETLKHCHGKGWKTIVFGHIGRDPENSLAPVCAALTQLTGIDFQFVAEWLDEARSRLDDTFVEQVQNSPDGTSFVLQNTRRYPTECALWKVTTDELAPVASRMHAICSDIRQRLCQVEINEAIAASNIDFSSSVIPLLMDRTALGFYITREMEHVREVRKSNLVVFSGLKANKLDDLEAALSRGYIDLVISAGSLAMALKKARAQLDGGDFFLGAVETDSDDKAHVNASRVEQAKRILLTCQKSSTRVVLPVDFVLDNGAVSETIPQDRRQFDIGPASRDLFASEVSIYIDRSRKSSSSYAMFYNGVFGKFEDPQFAEGTRSFIPLLKQMTDAGIATYVGGGEGRLALTRYGSVDDVTHAFTCGGTILKSLSDQHLAFLKAMYFQNVAAAVG